MNKHNDLQQRLAQRTLASLSLFIIVCVVVVTGIIAFLRPFSITVISLQVATNSVSSTGSFTSSVTMFRLPI
jgi:hypothetical protein